MKKVILVSLALLGLAMPFSIGLYIEEENNRKEEETNRLFMQDISKRDIKNETLVACYNATRVGSECELKSREEGGGTACGEEKLKYDLEKP